MYWTDDEGVEYERFTADDGSWVDAIVSEGPDDEDDVAEDDESPFTVMAEIEALLVSDPWGGKYFVTDESGLNVVAGDDVTDFRGEVWTFVGVTRGKEYNGTAKVEVEHKTLPNYHGDGLLRSEYYAQVFNLDVERY